MTLDGKVALITGGGSGIGRAAALLLARHGARIVVSGRRRPPIEQTVADIQALGREAVCVDGDVARADDTRSMVQACLDAFGGLDILVNNAGYHHPAPVTDVDEDDWDRHFAVNVKGPLLLSQAAMPVMARRGGGAIVNVSSVMGDYGHAYVAAYCASKAALNNLTKSLALAGAPEGIRVNTVSPAVVDTPIHAVHQSPEQARAFLERFTAMHPLGRVGRSEEVAAMIYFLVGEDAQWVTGAEFRVDGGFLAGRLEPPENG